MGFAVANELRADVGTDEGALKDVEGDVIDGEELPCVRYGETDVRDWEGGEMGGAEGKVFGGPAA